MENETYAADAYLKLHEDVKRLILETVIEELRQQPWGTLSTTLRGLMASELTSQMGNYRIVMKGHTASNY